MGTRGQCHRTWKKKFLDCVSEWLVLMEAGSLGKEDVKPIVLNSVAQQKVLKSWTFISEVEVFVIYLGCREEAARKQIQA